MDELVDPFRRLIEDGCPPATVRTIEAGGEWRALWRRIAGSGYLDALVPVQIGGAGLSLADVAPLIAVCGARAVPLPVGETMVARALLAEAGLAAPEGPIVLATGVGVTPLANVASHAVRGRAGTLELIELHPPARLPTVSGLDGIVPGAAGEDLRPIAATIRAQLIAGAAGRVLDLAVAYANDRIQFGKPIGRQQAVQQQLAVLAEQAIAARIAAAIGARDGLKITERAAAVAKYRASAAALQVASIAHAVFGAIGISEERDLQLLTRRLHGWRLADGSESYWAEKLGGVALGVAKSLSPPCLVFPGRVF